MFLSGRKGNQHHHAPIFCPTPGGFASWLRHRRGEGHGQFPGALCCPVHLITGPLFLIRGVHFHGPMGAAQGPWPPLRLRWAWRRNGPTSLWPCFSAWSPGGGHVPGINPVSMISDATIAATRAGAADEGQVPHEPAHHLLRRSSRWPAVVYRGFGAGGALKGSISLLRVVPYLAILVMACERERVHRCCWQGIITQARWVLPLWTAMRSSSGAGYYSGFVRHGAGSWCSPCWWAASRSSCTTGGISWLLGARERAGLKLSASPSEGGRILHQPAGCLPICGAVCGGYHSDGQVAHEIAVSGRLTGGTGMAPRYFHASCRTNIPMGRSCCLASSIAAFAFVHYGNNCYMLLAIGHKYSLSCSASRESVGAPRLVQKSPGKSVSASL